MMYCLKILKNYKSSLIYPQLEIQKRTNHYTIVSLDDGIIVHSSSLLEGLVKITGLYGYLIIELIPQQQKYPVLIKNIHPYILSGTNKNLVGCYQVRLLGGPGDKWND